MRTVEFGELDYPHAVKLGGPGMRILFLAPRYPYPARRGDQVRAFQLVRELARHAEVTLLSFGSGDPLPFEGVRSVEIEPTPAGRVAANLAKPSPLLPLQARLYLDQGMRRAVDSELERGHDVLHITLGRMGGYLPPATPGVHRHLDLVDSLGLNMRTRAAASRGPARLVFGTEARLMGRYEGRLVASADSSSLVSAADRDADARLAPASIIPMAVDIGAAEFNPPAGGAAPIICFFGNLGYFHNVEPARFLATDVLPRIRRAHPRAELRLIGARPSRAITGLTGLAGVSVRADVPDMAAELRECAVGLLPMFTGSGLKNKVLEAFAGGLPVVSNRLGVQGVDGAEPGVQYLVGESAAELAAATSRLLDEPSLRVQLAGSARELIEDKYSWGGVVERLLSLYRGGTA